MSETWEFFQTSFKAQIASYPATGGGGMYISTVACNNVGSDVIYLPMYNQIGTIYITATDENYASFANGTFLINTNYNYLSYNTTSQSSGTSASGVGFQNVFLTDSTDMPGTNQIYCWVNSTGGSDYGVQFRFNFAGPNYFITVVYVGTGSPGILTATNPYTG